MTLSASLSTQTRAPRVVSNVRADAMLSASELESSGARFLQASTDDLLGLAMDARVREAAQTAVRKLGVRAPRDNRVREELEARLAALLGTEAATVTSELSLLHSLPGRLVVEARTRARLDLATPETFFASEALEAMPIVDGAPPRVVITDALHRFEGELAPLPRLADIATRGEGSLIVIDTGGLGVLGAHGGGVADHLDVAGQIELHLVSLGGAVAGSGWAVAGTRTTLEALRSFWNDAPPIASLAACARSLELIGAEPHRRTRALENAQKVIDGLRQRGFDTGPCVTPWIPVWIGDEALCEQWLRALAESSVACRALLWGARSRLLLSLAATATDAQLDSLFEAVGRVARRLGVPSELPPVSRSSVRLAFPGSFAITTPAMPHWSGNDWGVSGPGGVPEVEDEQRPLRERLFDAVETLTWRAANLRGRNVPGAAAFRALIDRTRRR